MNNNDPGNEPRSVPADDGAELMTRAEEDRVVERLLAAEEDAYERGGALSVGAYGSLARSRGVPLEAVIRAACRGELASIVTSAAVTTPHH
jgi:hypothetical protein